jgi:hypothetical protein
VGVREERDEKEFSLTAQEWSSTADPSGFRESTLVEVVLIILEFIGQVTTVQFD